MTSIRLTILGTDPVPLSLRVDSVSGVKPLKRDKAEGSIVYFGAGHCACVQESYEDILNVLDWRQPRRY